MAFSLATLPSGTVLAGSVSLYLASYLLQRVLVAHLWDRGSPSARPRLRAEILVCIELCTIWLTMLVMPACFFIAVLASLAIVFA